LQLPLALAQLAGLLLLELGDLALGFAPLALDLLLRLATLALDLLAGALLLTAQLLGRGVLHVRVVLPQDQHGRLLPPLVLLAHRRPLVVVPSGTPPVVLHPPTVSGSP